MKAGIKINYKLIYYLIIIYLLYQLRSLYGVVVNVLLPFLIAFALAYIINVILKLLYRRLSKRNSILLLIGVIILVIVFVLYYIMPTIIQEVTSLFDSIIYFIEVFSKRYSVDISTLKEYLDGSYETVISKISNGMVSMVTMSLSFISNVIIVITLTIYFLLKMDSIKLKIKSMVSDKVYRCLKRINDDLETYFSSFIKIIIITFFEYSILYLIIGHPNALILGFLSGVLSPIPYFGSLIVSIIALITAFGSNLFYKVVAIIIVFSFIDMYLINPYVYSKDNDLDPLLIVILVFVFGKLFGLIGSIIALPTYIIFKDLKNS